MKYLYLVWSNLMRKKLRTILTMLSIAIAFLLFGYLSAINTALTMGVNIAGLDRLAVRHKVSLIQLLPESYQARIERIPGVDAASGRARRISRHVS
jgi:putative ABC transport system permease protein